MPRPGSAQKLLASVLDRLIDEEPKVSSEPAAEPIRSLAQVKAAVRRDLEWLLNTKQAIAGLPPDLRHLDRSVMTYGLPDFTHAGLTNPQDQGRLRRALEAAIGRFEPRLSQVRVRMEEGREFDRSLRFRIDALLRVEPEPEPVSFDSVLQLHNKAFLVRED